MIEKPNKAHFNLEQRTSTLYFEDQVHADYMMRGGVCWPIPVDTGKGLDVYGYIIMCGYDVKTGLVTVFEQTDFIVIDNILKPDRAIEYPGIAPWINRCWSKYFAQDFFWNQDWELAKTYRLQVIRSEMIEPKPQFIEIGWSDLAEAQQTLWKYVKVGKVSIEKDSKLYKQLELTKSTDKQIYPATHALMCCLCGIERSPYRKVV